MFFPMGYMIVALSKVSDNINHMPINFQQGIRLRSSLVFRVQG